MHTACWRARNWGSTRSGHSSNPAGSGLRTPFKEPRRLRIVDVLVLAPSQKYAGEVDSVRLPFNPRHITLVDAPAFDRAPIPMSLRLFQGTSGMLVIVAESNPGDSSSVEVETRESLLARVAQGDKAAFSDLYDQTASRVLGLIRRVLIDHAQSEEVTQEVFLEIWQSASRYEPNKGGATTWILTMAHRRAIDRIRASQSSRDRDMKIGVRDYDPGVDDVADSVEIRIENERVKKAMQQLTELQRQAITLAFYEGYTHSEVSTILHVPIGTVKTRLRDGMIRLRDAMGVTS